MTTETTTAPLPHEVPDGDAFFSMGFESLYDFHQRYPMLPGYPVRGPRGYGILLALEPIEGTKPVQYTANIDMGNEKGWRCNRSFIRHATWGVKQSIEKGFSWPLISELSEDALALLGEIGTPLRDSYEGMLRAQAQAKTSPEAFTSSGLDVAAFNKQTMPEGTEVRVPSGDMGTVMTIQDDTIWVDKGNDLCWQGNIGLVRHASWPAE